MRPALPLLILLAACGAGLPPAEGTISDAARAQALPQLVPLDPLLARASIPSRAEAAQAELAGRTAALNRQAIARPRTADLAARGRALRERAAALRAVEI